MRLEITDMAFGGDGVGRGPDGGVVFVPFAAPGETVEVEVVSRHKRFSRARLVSVVSASPDRVAPVCPWFGRCGGCQYQHLAYPVQAAIKQRQATEVLRRLGGLAAVPAWDAVVAASSPYGYRNKLRMEGLARATAGEIPDWGFVALDNQCVLPVDACPLAKAELLAHVPEAKADGRNRFVIGRETPPPLTLRLPADGGPVHFFGDPPPAGWPCLQEKLDGRPVEVPAGSFWQVNPEVAPQLLATLRRWAADTPRPVLVDAYGGVGAFALVLTGGNPAIRQTVVVEADRAAAAVARRNLAAWTVPGAEVLAMPAETALPRLAARFSAADAAVLLDPPRGGCHAGLLAALATWRPASLFYVSCHPASLARDLRILRETGGYCPRRIAWFDMFPQTAHFELAVELGREPGV